MSGVVDFFGAIASTVAGSTTTILTSTPPAGINSVALVYVTARAPGTDDVASWWQGLFAHKTAGGVLTLDRLADVIPAFATNDIKHSSIALNVVGGTVNLDVTGDPGFPGQIDWQAYVWRLRS